MAYDPSNEAEEAAGLLALARQTHEAHVAAAKEKAAGIIARAEEEASVILSDARAEYEHLEQQIASHREYEARYRSALTTYLTDLLDEIRVKPEDEFIAPSAAAAAVEAEVETSAFAVEEGYSEPTYEEPVYEAAPEPEPVFEEASVEEPVYEEPVYEESTEEVSAEEAPAEPVYEEPSFEAEPELVYGPEPRPEDYQEEPVADEFYDAPAVEVEDEVNPTFAEGEAPVPSFEPQDNYYGDDDPSDDLPAVPEQLDSFGSASEEIAALDHELAEHDEENAEEVQEFDELLAGEPKPATGSVAAQAPIFGDSDESVEDKGVRGFFGFKKS